MLGADVAGVEVAVLKWMLPLHLRSVCLEGLLGCLFVNLWRVVC